MARPRNPMSSGGPLFTRTTVGLTKQAVESLDELTEAWGVSRYLAISAVLECATPDNEAAQEKLRPYLTKIDRAQKAQAQLTEKMAGMSPEQLDRLNELLDKEKNNT